MTALVAVLVAACGTPSPPAPSSASPDPSETGSVATSTTQTHSGQAAEVTFTQDAGGEGGESSGRVDMNVIAATGLGVRATISVFTDPSAKDPEEVMRHIWDGSGCSPTAR